MHSTQKNWEITYGSIKCVVLGTVWTMFSNIGSLTDMLFLTFFLLIYNKKNLDLKIIYRLNMCMNLRKSCFIQVFLLTPWNGKT